MSSARELLVCARMQANTSPRRAETVETVERARRVLLAEDDMVMRRMLVQALERDGFEVTAVEDGAKLLARIQEAWLDPDDARQFDLLITDAHMPKLSGIDVLRELRTVDPSTPVLVISAFSDHEMVDTVEDLDGVVLDKPFDLSDLRTAALYYARCP
jgi:two-component system, NtrC family, response regulator AtoC